MLGLLAGSADTLAGSVSCGQGLIGQGVFAVSKRVRSERSKSKSLASATPSRWTPFGQPQLLAGEDAAGYYRLLAHVCAVVKPVDMIEEMLIADIVSLEWEVLRWCRLKWA